LEDCARKHISDRCSAHNRILHHLMIGGQFGIETGHLIGIAAIEGLDPSRHDVPWLLLVHMTSHD